MHLAASAAIVVALVACSGGDVDGDRLARDGVFIVTASEAASAIYRGQEPVLSVNGRITAIVRTGAGQAVLEIDRGGWHTINVLDGSELRELDEGSDLVSGPGRLAYLHSGGTDAAILDASTLIPEGTAVPMRDGPTDLLAVRGETVFAQST